MRRRIDHIPEVNTRQEATAFNDSERDHFKANSYGKPNGENTREVLDTVHEYGRQRILNAFDPEYQPPTILDLSTIPGNERVVNAADIDALHALVSQGVHTKQQIEKLLSKICPLVA